MKMYWSDYIGDTMPLTQGQHGAYLLLIAHYWKKGELIAKHCYSIARAKTGQEKSNVDAVLEEYFQRSDDRWVQPALDQAILESEMAYQRRVEAGSKGGRAKAVNAAVPSNAIAMLKQPESEPELGSEKELDKSFASPGKPATPPASEQSAPVLGITEKTALQAACKVTWAAYSEQYQKRYGVAPVRDVKANTSIKGFVQAVGMQDAPAIAVHYVTLHERYYVEQCHPAMLLQKDVQKLRTLWARTQRSSTQGDAQQYSVRNKL
jgi:uncharacterized protein YdaU (DUF1376 family)